MARRPVPLSDQDRQTLIRLKKRLKAARNRAAYWSGRPSFSGFGFVPGKRGRKDSPDLEYEMAMADLVAIADDIEKLTGARPATTDVQQVFREKFAALALGSGCT